MLPFIVFINTDRRHGVLLQACLKAFWLLARDAVQTTSLHSTDPVSCIPWDHLKFMIYMVHIAIVA